MRRTHFDSVLVVAALFVVLLPASSQSSPITFERAYGGTADDLGMSAVQTADGGYVVTGATESFGAGGFDFYLVKTDLRGDTLWTRTFGGTQDDVGWLVQQTTDGGYIVAGETYSLGAGGDDAYLIKTNANGDTLWTRSYGGAMDDAAASVEQTTDGGYIVAGSTKSFGAGGWDVWLIKTNASGEMLWTRTYGGAGDDRACAGRQTTDGGYIITGVTWSFGAGAADVYLIKTDSMGDTLWTRTFGGDSNDYGNSVQQTADGGYIVAGWTALDTNAVMLYVIKTKSNGDTLWTKTIDGPGSIAEGSSIEQVKDGGYIIVGCCGTVRPDVFLVRTDYNGDTLWTRTFGGSDFDDGYSVQQTTDGGYVIAGQTYSFGAGGSDFYLIKTDENGNLAVAESKAELPRTAALSLICAPNPFRSSTRMSLSAPNSKPVSLRVYDAQGRLVRTFAASRRSCTIWDGRDAAGQLLPSGTYLVRCDAAGTHVTARLVLQR